MAKHHQDHLGGVVGVLALLAAALMAITQPGGAGTTIYLYDDASNTNHAAAPGPHTFAEIAAAFPADFVDNGTNRKSYRGKVTVQVGDTGVGTATTTLQDTNSDATWDSTKTLAFRATQATSWYLTLGTKVGTGNEASGVSGCNLCFGAATTLRGTIKLYGSVLRTTTGAVTWFASSDGAGEAINSLLQSISTGTAPFTFGSATVNIGNAYNLDISHTTAAQVLSGANFSNIERMTIAAPAPTTFLLTSNASIEFKDLALFGSPTQSDLRWGSGAAVNWSLVRPRWTGLAPKLSIVGGGTIAAANGAHEYWIWNIKAVDRNGTAVASIPVALIDGTGTTQVSTTTGSDGQLNYGSGLTANCVVVADHYATSGAYAIRHRSPFEFKCNTPDLVGFNPAYLSRHYKFYFPGYESVTTSAGTFEDMQDIVNLEEGTGNPTVWVELEMP